jgi:hypothetical protein
MWYGFINPPLLAMSAFFVMGLIMLIERSLRHENY